MEPKRYTWADSGSESEDSFDDERVVTALPNIHESAPAEVRKKPKKKRDDREEELKTDPNLVTKIDQSKKQTTKSYLRPDGTPMSKKEIQQKELEEMDSLFDEFGIAESSAQSEVKEQEGQQEPIESKKGKTQVGGKPSNRAAINAVRAEISARQEKAKKSQKKSKQQYPH